MVKLVKKPVFSVLLVIASLNICSGAHAGLLSFNDFFADPSVSVAADGSEATIREDIDFAVSTISLDPFLGDPDIIIPGLNVFLNFDFSFNEALNENDEFVYALFDSSTLEDLAFAAFTDSKADSVSLDLSSFVGRALGLYFGLNSLDSLLDSTANISNLSLITVISPPPDSQVPEPSTLMASLAALMCFFVTRKRKVLMK